MYKRGELLFISVLVLTIFMLLTASVVAIAKEKQMIDKIENSNLYSANEDLPLLDESIGKVELEKCSAKTSEVVGRFDPFIKGLEKITIHKRKDMRRGLANSHTVQIRCMHDIEEFENVLIHEFGHVVDINYLEGKSFSYSDSFKLFSNRIPVDDPSIQYYKISFDTNDIHKPKAEFNSFISGYASENVFEDFAESFLAYIKYGPEFRELITDNKQLERKYNFMRDFVFDGFEFDLADTPKESALSLFEEADSYPFDVTVMHRNV